MFQKKCYAQSKSFYCQTQTTFLNLSHENTKNFKDRFRQITIFFKIFCKAQKRFLPHF